MKNTTFAVAAVLVAMATTGASAHSEGIPAGITPVTDQGDTLQCWAVTTTARADLDAGLKLSARYTVYIKTKLEVTQLILGGKFKTYRGQLAEGGPFKNIYYEQGGIYADGVEAFKVGGTMPEEAYPGFPQKDEGLFDDLNDLIGEYAHKAKPDEAEVEHRVTTVLDRRWGKPPESFEFEGRTYDARGFFNRALPAWKNSQGVELNYAPGSRDGVDVTPAFDGAAYRSYKTGNHGKLMRVLEESLRAGYKPVLQYKVIDEEILDHYVLAIEPEWDAEGHLRRLLIKNTWDTSPTAHFGFHWIEADYFSLFEAVEIHPDLAARFRAEGLLK